MLTRYLIVALVVVVVMATKGQVLVDVAHMIANVIAGNGAGH